VVLSNTPSSQGAACCNDGTLVASTDERRPARQPHEAWAIRGFCAATSSTSAGGRRCGRVAGQRRRTSRGGRSSGHYPGRGSGRSGAPGSWIVTDRASRLMVRMSVALRTSSEGRGPLSLIPAPPASPMGTMPRTSRPARRYRPGIRLAAHHAGHLRRTAPRATRRRRRGSPGPLLERSGRIRRPIRQVRAGDSRTGRPRSPHSPTVLAGRTG
jgi:hypothetical protein